MRWARRLLWASLTLALAAASGRAGDKGKAPPPLAREHRHPTGAFTFRTPESWVVQESSADPNALQAGDGSLVVRFLYHAGEQGYDSLHVSCMLDRLAGPMAQEPEVKYEYEFVSSVSGHHRSLDSAFQIRYDTPIMGHQVWRQRTFTVVGAGHSLCVISHVPAPVWRKSRETRTLLDAVLASVTFR